MTDLTEKTHRVWTVRQVVSAARLTEFSKVDARLHIDRMIGPWTQRT